MTQEPYTLSWILPFVRQSLKGVGNFDYRNYVQGLWNVLEKAQVPGVVRAAPFQPHLGQTFLFDQAPHDLRTVATEAFFYLFHHGYITPEPSNNFLNHPNFNRYYITKRGLEWFNDVEPFPEEADGYMKFLCERVPNMDSIIRQYIVEALAAFERQAYFAAAVMLGAASEKALYLLAESVLGAFKDARRQEKLKALSDRRKLLELFEYVRNAIHEASKSKLLPYADSEGSTTHLMSLYEAMRIQRNDAVHPMNATVSAESVRLLIRSFPYSLSKSEELRAWLTSHPKSI